MDLWKKDSILRGLAYGDVWDQMSRKERKSAKKWDVIIVCCVLASLFFLNNLLKWS